MLSYRQGKSLLRQTVANIRHREYCANHPASYGWRCIGATPNGLVIWEEPNGAGLMRHPAGDCWLLFHCEVWQPVDKHISELSAELETIKARIEFEIFTEELTATVERLAA